MRNPFVIQLSEMDLDKPNHFMWKEISRGDGLPMRRFFNDVLRGKAHMLSRQDGLRKKSKKEYRKEARDIMFTLRDFPFGIHQILPVAAAVGLPNLLRRRQTEKDVEKGISGRHIALLWHNASKQVVGLSVLERTVEPNQAELSVYKNPCLQSKTFLVAVKEYMAWSQRVAGYKHFVAHIEALTDTQRGNRAAQRFAHKLGFAQTGFRGKDDPKGNGKDTLVFSVRDWKPSCACG
ncbi:MAG: GNAT family protein [Bdellovibrionales bacterium]|jgi:hypothetical protein